jgi:hypothetical protein
MLSLLNKLECTPTPTTGTCQGQIQDLWLGGGVSRRGIWGPLLGPQRVESGALVGGPGGQSPPEALGGLRNYRHLFEQF